MLIEHNYCLRACMRVLTITAIKYVNAVSFFVMYELDHCVLVSTLYKIRNNGFVCVSLFLNLCAMYSHLSHF